MRLTVYTFAVAALFCAVTYEASQAAPIAPPGGLRQGPVLLLRFTRIIGRGYSYHYIAAMVIAPTGGPRASIIGPPMAQNAGAIGGIKMN